MRGTRKTKLSATYNLYHTTLQLVDSYKYLGAIISPDLSRKQHVNYMTNNANRMLDYLKRNFDLAPLCLIFFSIKRQGDLNSSLLPPSCIPLLLISLAYLKPFRTGPHVLFTNQL